MNIVLVEPFYTASHKQWADGLVAHTSHQIDLLTMTGHHWKWRMHGAAVTLSDQLNALHTKYDLIICTDMIDVAVFRSLLKGQHSRTPVVTYFHENQITYPWSATDPDIKLKRDHHYGWINYTSALAADYVLFNSEYHQQSFLAELPHFLGMFPDGVDLQTVQQIAEKSDVLPIGINPIAARHQQHTVPHIVWNHRWEYDKNPEVFFKALFRLKEEAVPFRLHVVGESYPKSPTIFKKAKEILHEEIITWGYVSRAEYERILSQADILPVTSNQDFFGISVVEGISAGCIPILPRRLAFPEHLQGYDSLYYETDEQYFTLLKNIVLDHTKYDKANIARQSEKYHWENIVGTYDEKLSYLSALISHT